MAGRPQECDRAEAVRRAALQFWRTGLEGTSVDDLVASTGMNRFGLYGELGGKKGLFLKACDAYSRESSERLLEPLRTAPEPVAALKQFFRLIIDRQLSSDTAVPSGCFMARTLSHEAETDPEIRQAVRAHFKRFELGLAQTLARAAGCSPASAPVRTGALLLLNTLFGLLQTVQLHPSRSVLNRIADAAVRDAVQLCRGDS
jgi:TetR/AcrR family transcriptional repressor of nem operon